MLRRINTKNYWVTVISHKRAENVKKMTKLIGPATWYVGKDEGEDYIMNEVSAVVESGGLCQSRNQALRDAFVQDIPCIELSDDLAAIRTPFYNEHQKRRLRHITFEEAIKKLDSHQDIFKLLGLPPTDNPLNWLGKDVNLNRFIVGDFILVRPCELFFDENLKLKEDYDYTLQHITASGGTLRQEDVMATFGHRTNPGGAVDIRNPELEQEAIKYLKNKWGKFIVDNPVRPNEILLRL